jgi:hypothetical protein
MDGGAVTTFATALTCFAYIMSVAIARNPASRLAPD